MALRFGRKGEVVNFDDLGLYRLIFQIEDRAELRAFVEQVLGPLLEYDRKHRTDFVRRSAPTWRTTTACSRRRRSCSFTSTRLPTASSASSRLPGLELAKTEDCLLARVALMILEDEAVG